MKISSPISSCLVGLCAMLGVNLAAQTPQNDRNLQITPPAAVAAPVALAPRVALVLGNGKYKDAPLANPVNDAKAIAQALRKVGFSVTLKENADIKVMLSSIREFGDQLRKGGTGVFYYAGHGMQIKGRNYLIPVDSTIDREDEVAYAAVDAQAILDKMDAAGNGTNIMILDACRNNPFARSFRSAQQGLAQMEAPVGTLVAFATAPGAVASDGAGQNGLYTQHLLSAILEPGAKVEDVFKKVRSAVRRDSQGKQTPWEVTSLEGDFYFNPPAPVAVKPVESSPEKTMWSLVKDSSQAVELKAFLSLFPNGQFAADAAGKIAKIEATQKISGAASPTRPQASVPAKIPNVAGPDGELTAWHAQLDQSTQNAELEAWTKLKDSKNLQALRDFVAQYPNGKYSTEAAKRILQQEAGALAAAGSGQTAPNIQPVKKPPIALANPYGFRVGDRWNFQVVDRYKGEVIDNWSLKITKILPNGDLQSGNNVLSPEGNVRSFSNKRFINRVYSEAEFALPKTMRVGHKEDFQFTDVFKRTDGVDVEQEWKGTLTVKAKERIKVPAGEFDTFRIEREATINGKHINGSARWFGHHTRTGWYAPKVHYWVAYEDTYRSGSAPADKSRIELTSYEVQEWTSASAQ